MAISARVERIIHEVEALSEDERNDLMRALDSTGTSGISAEWSEEIHRRVREIEEGKVQLVEEEDFFRKLRVM